MKNATIIRNTNALFGMHRFCISVGLDLFNGAPGALTLSIPQAILNHISFAAW
ncbi:MAG: hypothetical protein ABJA18_10805 [bacterium]